jgi:hypothetical protein
MLDHDSRCGWSMREVREKGNCFMDCLAAGRRARPPVPRIRSFRYADRRATSNVVTAFP